MTGLHIILLLVVLENLVQTVWMWKLSKRIEELEDEL